MQRIIVREVYTDPLSGHKTWKIGYNGARIVRRWLESRGLSISETARGFTKGDHGSFMFNTGCGYSKFDADLLGGAGDGLTERRFVSETGFYFYGK